MILKSDENINMKFVVWFNKDNIGLVGKCHVDFTNYYCQAV